MVRCLCTQRSFQGPVDGVCRLLALRFWPLKEMFDFRLLAPPCTDDDDEDGMGGDEGSRRHGVNRSRPDRRDPGRWVEL